mmetsp:Transcript_98564/g.301583  ORF Transcript_98564/g.301583 Transcript_98564/m.301583 type:complete len:242 (-) Transcript_98564:259-984(-)
MWLQPSPAAPLVQGASICQHHEVVLPARKVNNAQTFRRQAADEPGVPLGGIHVAHGLLAQTQLAVVIAPPDPQLSAARHRGREIIARAHPDDLRGRIWGEDRVVGLEEIVYLLELHLVAGVAMAQAAEVAFARGIKAAFLREDQRVLRTAGDLFDLLAGILKLLDLCRDLHRLLVPVTMRAGARPKAAAPAPCPQTAVLCDNRGMVGTERRLLHGDPHRHLIGVRRHGSLGQRPAELRILV